MLSAFQLQDAFGAPLVLLGGGFSQDVLTLQNNLTAVGALSCSSNKCDGIVGPKTTLALLQVLDHIPGVPTAVSDAIAYADGQLPGGLVGTLTVGAFLGLDSVLNPLYGFISDNAGPLAFGVAVYMAKLGKVPAAAGSTPAPTGLPPGIKMLHVDTGALATVTALPYRAGTITAFDPAIGKFRIAVPKGKAPPGFQGVIFDFDDDPMFGDATHVELTPQTADNPALKHVTLPKLLVATGAQQATLTSSPLFWVGVAAAVAAAGAGAWWLLK